MPEIIKKSYSYKVTILCLALAAIIIGIVSYIELKRAKKTEVSAQVISSEELTFYTPEAELSASYKWSGEEVTHLWKLRIKFVNSGKITIIGKSNQKNIINDGINFVFPDNTRILRIQMEDEDFTNIMKKKEINQLQIQFSQWRSGEYALASFYIASEEPLDRDPFPMVPKIRDIVNGEVVVQDLRDRKLGEPLLYIDRAPKYISISGKIIGWGIVAAVALGSFVLFIGGCIAIAQLCQIAWWKRNHLSEFTKFIDKIKPPLTNEKKEEYSKKPFILPAKHWDKFKGQQIPVKNIMFESESQKEAIPFMLVSLGVLFGSIALILSLIPA